MKIKALLIVAALFFSGLAHGQGTNNNLTTTVQLLNNSSATGRVVVPAANQIGAGAHLFTYCSSATTLQLIVEESPDNVSSHYTQISPVYGPPLAQLNGNNCNTIQVGNYFTYPAINVLSISGGTVSIWYSGTQGTISVFPPAINSLGATTPAVCDQQAIFSVATGTTTNIISGVAGTNIYVCSIALSFVAAPGNGTIALSTGGGATCSTFGFNRWGPLATSANTPLLFFAGGPFGSLVKAPFGQNVCLAAGAITTTVQGSVTYAQF